MSAPDDRQPESGDASHFDFDDLVLDEEFVRAATISEASATARVERKREQQVRRSHRFPRPQLRRLRKGWHRWNQADASDRRTRPAPEAPKLREWTAAQWAAVLVVVALAAVFVWALTASHSSSHSSTPSSAASIAAPSGAAPVGSCLGIDSSGNHISPTLVSCSSAHSVQITGYAPIASENPTSGALAQLVTTCRTSAERFVAGQFPPEVGSGDLLPSTTQWTEGDHDAACTVATYDNAGTLGPSYQSWQSAGD